MQINYSLFLSLHLWLVRTVFRSYSLPNTVFTTKCYSLPHLAFSSHGIHSILSVSHCIPPPVIASSETKPVVCSVLLILSPIDPIYASSFPLSVHPSIFLFINLSIHPFISIGVCEVNWTHLMGLCVSRKWLAQVFHWLYRWATHCCPHLPWC